MSQRMRQAGFNLNQLIFTGTLLFLLFFHFAFPLMASSTSIGLILLWALATNSIWAVIHELIHGHFLDGKKNNLIAGRVLSVFFGVPFYVVKAGHLTHHAYNRDQGDRPDAIELDERNTLVRQLKYYFWLLGGLYITEVLSNFLAFLPKTTLLNIANNSKSPVQRIVMTTAANKLNAIRIDAAMVLILYGTTFYLYHDFWPYMLSVIILRGFLISMMDNVYHYKTRTDDKRFAFNLSMPEWLSLCLLNGNYHGVHHKHPAKPWFMLPTLFNDERFVFQHAFGKHWIKQLEGAKHIKRLNPNSNSDIVQK